MDDNNRRQNEFPTTYAPPRALRLSQARAGRGGEPPTCRGPGSGAEGDCVSGFAAGIMCYQAGSSADKCDGPGSGANEAPPP